MDDQNVYSVFKRSDGELLEWVTPFAALNNDLQRGYFKREYVDTSLVPLHAEYADLTLDVATECYNDQLQLCSQYQTLSNECGEGDVGCQALYASLDNERDGLHDQFQQRLEDLQKQGKEYITFALGGQKYTVLDFRPFVDTGTFRQIIPSLYDELGDDDRFIHEIWYIVSQMTTYSKDIEETPKYPLETFLSGGGDCEDTAILVASMLKAVPRTWTVSLVYMDANDPVRPSDINHVIVAVDTGEKKYFIETTSKSEMNPYTSVTGYYLTV